MTTKNNTVDKPTLEQVKSYIDNLNTGTDIIDIEKFYNNVILKSATDWRDLLKLFSNHNRKRLTVVQPTESATQPKKHKLTYFKT